MFKQYLENEQLNFQVNRFLEPYHTKVEVQNEVQEICKNIHDLSSWYNQWLQAGTKQKQLQNYALASAYFQLADFFLTENDPKKQTAYLLFKETFYLSIAEQNIQLTQVPYENSKLPIAIIQKPHARKWLLFHGGFDSYLEELIRLSLEYLNDLSEYNLLLFEGPGQGLPLKEGIFMTECWEKPVKAILDHFRLNEAALLGMSLGGLLSLRAAAKEKRITKVIAFDTFYSMMDAFSLRAPSALQTLPDLTQPCHQLLFNQTIENYAKTTIDLHFKLTKAKAMFGKDTASEVFQELANYTLEGIEKQIRQPVLLLAGNEDMYVPTFRTGYLQSRLVNSAYVEACIFTQKTGGQYHCQVGKKITAFTKINDFLKIEQLIKP
jgi:pimeloyl-ACP methyl ester carboxylesterase